MPIWTIVSKWNGGLSPQRELGKALEGLEDKGTTLSHFRTLLFASGQMLQ